MYKTRIFLRFAFIPALSLLVLAIAVPAFGTDPTEEGWVLKKQTDNLTIYNREKEGSDIKELLAIGIIDAPPARVFKVVGDYENFKDFMPYTVASHVIKTEPYQGKTRTWWFTRLNLPLVSDRYYTLVLTDGKEGDSYKSEWFMAKDLPPDPAWGDPSIAAYQGKGSEPVKTRENKGYWLFEPVEGGTKTRAHYYVYTDPGGAIPTSIANKANSIAVPKLFNAVRERVKDPKYN